MATGLIAIVIAASAVEAQTIAPSQTITVSPVIVTLQAGAQPTSAPLFEIPRVRMPLSDAEMEQLSRQPNAAAANVTVVTPNAQPPRLATNCTTNSGTGSAPSDIIGAAGPTNIVVMTNTSIVVYNKTTCAVVVSNSLNGLCSAAAGEQYFDPQVLWDNTTQRFIVTTESTFNSGPNQHECFGVSTDSTGTNYFMYTIPIINSPNFFCATATTDFWDYPHVGSVNGSEPKWMITANLFHANNTSQGALITIPKGPTLTGGQATFTCFNSSSLPINLTPTNVLDNNSTAYLLSPGSGGGSSVARFALSPGPSLAATSSISINPWTNPPKAVQPNGEILDTLDGRFVAATIQNGTSLWNTHNVSSGGNPPVNIVNVYQFGTTATTPVNFTNFEIFSGNSTPGHLFNASLATNGARVFINLSSTIPGAQGINPSMLIFVVPSAFGGFINTDTVATSTSQFTNCGTTRGCRWGDNSSIQIDPSNIYNAWGFNQVVTGTSEFNWGTQGALEAPPGGVTTHDFDNDGNSDILWRDGTTQTVAAWLMNGFQVQQSGSYGVVANNWTIVGQRDFNGDGFSDLLFRDSVTGTPAIWLLFGLQVLQKGGFGPVDNNWIVAGTGDFNGDGRGDILWFHNPTRTVAVWLLNGFSVLQASSIGTVPSGWAIVGTGDFNGDGMTDILWYHAASGTVAIWLLNGTSVLQTGMAGVLGGGWSIVGTGDFNGDLKSDILWYHGPSGTVGAWLMNGMSVLQAGAYSAVVLNWQISETGDFNADGRSDILWRDTVGGGVAVWLLNGLSVLQTGNVGMLGLNWAIQGANAD